MISNDQKLVARAGIHKAIIVDDGYDEIPQVDELLDREEWNSFFDDTRQSPSAERITDLFPDYDPDNWEILKQDQGFIAVLWSNRGVIEDLLHGIFTVYEQKLEANRRSLAAVESALTSLNIPFEKCGRDFVEAAVYADLIILDLFLGIQQSSRDRQLTVDRLNEALDRRKIEGLLQPSIVLMSQIPGVTELAKEFRQDTALHASAFRHIRKTDLSKSERMKGLILTLASHRPDSQALASFMETWEKKAHEAVRSAAGTLRKIDIDDLQHIKSMLLRFEGLNTSSYMLDIFDRVLQYEIESHSEVLDSAIRLDTMVDSPAPLMISNDRDTYAILERTLFVSPNRRDHVTGSIWPVAFGDILGPKRGTPIKRRGFFWGRADQVFFVASPACDLIRKDGLTTVLLVAGTLKEIDLTNPGLAVKEETTPVIKLDDNKRFQVDWNFGDLRTINLAKAKQLLHSTRGDASIYGRLREGAALNLRQQLLSHVGRVGELAPLPRSWKFSANLHLPRRQGGTEPIVLPDEVTITGNIIIPKKGVYASVIIDSSCEEDLTAALLGLDLTNVAPKSHKMFKVLKDLTRIRQIFRSGFQGIEMPLDRPRKAGLLKLDEELPDQDGRKPKIDLVATIVEGADLSALDGWNQLSEAGLILHIHTDDTA